MKGAGIIGAFHTGRSRGLADRRFVQIVHTPVEKAIAAKNVPEASYASAIGADLSACDLEPIRIPGAIQPHGRMLVLEADGLRLAAHSENAPAAWREQVLTELPREALSRLLPGASPVTVAPSLSAHRSLQHVIVEWEPEREQPLGEAPIYSLTRVFLPRLQKASTLADLTQLVASEMKRLTGFGRCLVYRFDEEGHGEVLAERVDEGYDSYAGHHFPAGDIPKQARDLYVLNQFRLIADATYAPVPLVTSDRALKPADIDLSLAQLRSVSPVHLEYMRNMRTLASMSVSIVIDGRLWGLISCHDHAPRHLASPTRSACEHLGQLLALQIQAKEANEQVAQRLELRRLTLDIVSHLAESDATLQRLVSEPALMLRVADATGAAVVRDDQVWSIGAVPEDAQIRDLAAYLSGLGKEVHASHAIAVEYPPAEAFAEIAAGIMSISISQVHRHLVIWFRPEIVRSITWAGDPRKPASSADGRIHPRHSFASWTEQLRGRSGLWSAAQLAAAFELRQALIGIVLRRAEELAVAATELGRLNKELEAFSYTVSHDLRAPMRHIAGYVDLVLETEGARLEERSHRYLAHVKEAAAFAGLLVDALLDFSRMGRAALKRREVDTGALVEGLVAEVSRVDPERRIEWRIDADLPKLHGDPVLLQVAVRNLLANAAKYSRARDPAHIAVRGVRREEGEGIEVEDDGVGFQMKYVEKLFGVFQRLHQADEFEGTGIGLANVKRIVERHGGTVWARGTVEQGATFGFVVPRAPDDVATKAATIRTTQDNLSGEEGAETDPAGRG